MAGAAGTQETNSPRKRVRLSEAARLSHGRDIGQLAAHQASPRHAGLDLTLQLDSVGAQCRADGDRNISTAQEKAARLEFASHKTRRLAEKLADGLAGRRTEGSPPSSVVLTAARMFSAALVMRSFSAFDISLGLQMIPPFAPP